MSKAFKEIMDRESSLDKERKAAKMRKELCAKKEAEAEAKAKAEFFANGGKVEVLPYNPDKYEGGRYAGPTAGADIG